jgi:S1-C subfamily serine protease
MPAHFRKEETLPLGFHLQPLTAELAAHVGTSLKSGVVVTDIDYGSLAEQLEFRRGDVITSVGGVSVKTAAEFRAAVGAGDLKKGIIINFNTRDTQSYKILKTAGE